MLSVVKLVGFALDAEISDPYLRMYRFHTLLIVTRQSICYAYERAYNILDERHVLLSVVDSLGATACECCRVCVVG